MKYELELPEDVDRRLSQKAAETGEDVVQLIHVAVGRFVDEGGCSSTNGDWSEEAEARRRTLIDKDIAGTISAAEQAELGRLDRMANDYFDRIAPPPIAGARRLHDQLHQTRDSRH